MDYFSFSVFLLVDSVLADGKYALILTVSCVDLPGKVEGAVAGLTKNRCRPDSTPPPHNDHHHHASPRARVMGDGGGGGVQAMPAICSIIDSIHIQT